jgi:hypothetical protein
VAQELLGCDEDLVRSDLLCHALPPRLDGPPGYLRN